MTGCSDSVAGRSSTKADEKEWIALWHVQMPAKIRVFLWRLARQSLPFGDVLHHRNMKAQSTCPFAELWTHGNTL
jgi:hypothetical protein